MKVKLILSFITEFAEDATESASSSSKQRSKELFRICQSILLVIGVGVKVKDIFVASLIELGEVEEESEDLFASGDDEALSASAL